MKNKAVLTLLIFLLFSSLGIQVAYADIYTWEAILLNEKAQKDLRQYVRHNEEARAEWLVIQEQAEKWVGDAPKPIEVVNYEGLLDSNPKRVETVASLMDMQKLAHFYYAWIITEDARYLQKIKEYVLAWTSTYKATGNTINENKFEAIYLAYHVARPHFSEKEQQQVDLWIREVAEAEINRKNVPMNNWQAKRIKLLLYSGIILGDRAYQQWALDKYREYINHSLRADGSSYDLEQRDALAYHVSGLKPLILLGIVYDQFKTKFSEKFNPYTYVSENGSSIKKSVDFVLPYALGEQQHQEWVHSRVKLDHERAAAGLAKYQKGVLYKASQSLPMYEQAMYFDADYQQVVQEICANEEDREGCKGWMYYVVMAIKK